MTDVKKSIRANRGTELECLGWEQEAVLRMLRNNLDPEVAEKPEDLIVYGGLAKPHGIGTLFTPLSIP